jgi:uncharacterized membrane protein
MVLLGPLFAQADSGGAYTALIPAAVGVDDQLVIVIAYFIVGL